MTVLGPAAATPAVDLKEAQLALSKAKILLMAQPDSAFFTCLAFSLRYYFDETIPTACTNAVWVRINPAFFMALNAEERVFLILHETLHVAYMHMMRRGDRCPDRWNIATDHVINLQLIERGFRMPKMGLADPQFRGMNAEEVYPLLPANPGKPKWADLVETDDQTANAEIQKEVEDILVRAQMQSKMAGDKPGTIPGEIEIFINKLLNPKLPWQRILQKYLQSFAKNDYTFRKPNRRFFPKHILPSLYSKSLIDLALAVDASGSVSDGDFLQFVSETHTLLKMMKPKKMTLLQFDCSLKSVDEISSVQDLLRVKFTGRGGTAIGPVLEWANQHKPQLLLVFTDGGFAFYPGQDTRVDTVWLIHNCPHWTAPFGKVIHYEI